MEYQCKQDPPLEFLKAVEQFNRGDYYECHETLEALWRNEQESIRDLYKGILQIGVAIHHAKRANLRGALRLMASGMELLGGFAPSCLGIDVLRLVAMSDHARKALERLDPGQSLAPELIPKIQASRQHELPEQPAGVQLSEKHVKPADGEGLTDDVSNGEGDRNG
jgi:uncharacterized protein